MRADRPPAAVDGQRDEWGEPESCASRHGTHHVYFVAIASESHRGRRCLAHRHVGKAVRHVLDRLRGDGDGRGNGNRAVTLDRVATKLRVSILDEIPEGCASVAITPDKWYYGLDYVTGDAVGQQRTERLITVVLLYQHTGKSCAFHLRSVWRTGMADRRCRHATPPARRPRHGGHPRCPLHTTGRRTTRLPVLDGV